VIRREVVLSPEARADLLALYDWIAAKASPEIALDYIGRLENFVLGLDLASARGTRRDDIREGLRIIGFERRVTIAFNVTKSHVVILRFYYGGQNWTDDLDTGPNRA